MAKKTKEKVFDLSILDNQKIQNVELSAEMKKAYIDYSMSVIVSRALPDVRDGLKPVHRRILYDMFLENLFYENDFRKSATTVGSVLGRFHPHGDSSVYDAMVRLAQNFSLRYPLVLGKGNFGSVDGDPAAAYRYTEAKMAKISAEMLADIKKETVDFVPNYDDKHLEPDVLPARFPNLLVNGSSGIAVGMATNIPPHNLCEVIDGIVATIDDPEITIEELMNYIQGPDFPTAGVIMGKSGIRQAYTTGRGRIIVRAKAEIEDEGGANRIVVTELPYQVNKQRLAKYINEMVRDGKIEGISHVRDESDENMRLIVYLKRDANPNVVLNNLYKFTQMQETFGVIMLALVDKQPKILNLREMIDYYIAHQKDVITRRTKHDLKEAEEHAHLLEGYRTAIDHIDEVIDLIRASKTIPEAKEALMNRFALSEVQATAIVQMQLGRLSGLERDKIEADYKETMEKIESLRAILADEGEVLKIVKDDLNAIREKYGDERRTEISMISTDLDIDDLIDEEQVVITLTHNGYTKRVPTDTYHAQRRGGRGVAGMATREEDFVEHLLTTSTHAQMLFFTTKGVVYKLKAYQIPEAGRQAKGMAIVNLLPLENDEKITAMISVSEFEEGKYLTFITKQGTVKKTDLMSYSKIRAGGLRAIELAEDDELIQVQLTDGEERVIIGTRNGMAICFDEKDVRPMGRTARGVRGIRLKDGDYVIGACLASEDSRLLVVTENGYGKKTELSEYKVQTRGGKGIFTYRITEKTGKVAGLCTITDDEDIMLITSDGVVIRMDSTEISTFGRQTQGVRIMRLAEGVSLVSMAKTEHEEIEEATEEAPETAETES
ncbi:MAG: DNA gyrase subunit A [Ruminococcaceae bacterium]|nr:DNA gyrase subunit A [Oscillospiraceae bacterium]